MARVLDTNSNPMWLLFPGCLGFLIWTNLLVAQTKPIEQAKPAAKVARSSDVASQADAWGQWRGPAGNGSSDTAKPPVSWSESTNVHWKTPIPGLGHASPVVWGQKVFVTSAVKFGPKFEPIYDKAPGSHDNLPVSQKHKYMVYCVDRESGKILWERTANENVPHEGSHYSGSLASASPIADQKHVFAYFGSHGLFCYDHAGKLIWKKSFGKMNTKHAHGEGSTPVLHGNTLVINWDHEGQSWVAAFDKSTGKQIWKRERNEVTSWSSPIVVEHKGQRQLIVAGTERVRSYDLQTGNIIWECGGLSNNVCASPVAANGIVVIGSSYEIKAMFAVRLDGAKGDITGSENVLWFRNQRTPYVPSPLIYQNKVYFFRHYQGVLTQVDLETGEEEIGPFRVNGLREIYASPVAANDKIYLTGRSGVTLVISHSELPRLLSANRLEDSFSASPALVGNDLVLRGENSLYLIRTSPSRD